jgi:DNA-binding MarR family transcriptional regulator
MAQEQGEEAGRTPIVLGLLESIERDGTRSQRGIASELGVALGLVNAYLRRCIKKGLIKVGEAPARRYAYYLTPQGFAEKSRLTIEYLSYSFSFFREAKAECARICQAARGRELRTRNRPPDRRPGRSGGRGDVVPPLAAGEILRRRRRRVRCRDRH